MTLAAPETTCSLIVDGSGADLTRKIDHLRNKRVEVVRAPRHKKLYGLELRAFDGAQHDIAEIQKPRALGNNTHAHAGVNQRHDGMNLGQLLNIVGRNTGLGEQISNQIAKIISFVR